MTRGVKFWKMTGSGNDFVFIDETAAAAAGLDSPAMIGRICSRTHGVGADGVVFLRHGTPDGIRIRYFNRDGSRGELCGNASLCTTSLVVSREIARPDGLAFGTDIGEIRARMAGGEPEIDLQPARDTRLDAGIERRPGEQRIGYTNTGVPHLVVIVGDIDAVPLAARGAELRRHGSLEAGANVNFVVRTGAAWRMRTYERGVEGESEACGTGAAACAVLLSAWKEASGELIEVLTTSGRTMTVTLRQSPEGVRPSLRGEGRIVFAGELIDL